jgi:hypothetical protein
MSILVPIVLFSWIPVVLLFFVVMPPRRAVLVSFAVAWMFLPMAGYKISGLPDYSKTSATMVGVLLGVSIFDSSRVLRFSPHWFDLPALIWCTCGFATSLVNGLGAYDGFSVTVSQVVMWGFSYFVGRLYFNDAEGLRELAVAIFIGGLIYIPFCLFEIRMSPRLHKWVYGYHQHIFAQTKRFSGYRPMVFMQHGLMVGMWMAMASLVGVWLWMTGAIKQVRGVPMSLLVPALLVTTVLCKSAGALGLLLIGIATLVWIRLMRNSAALLLLVAIGLFYVTARGTGMWTGENLVAVIRSIDGERADSIQTRMENENLLVAKAGEQPIVGWGGWNRARVFDERGRDIAITDGMWIVAFGQKGLVGLVSWLSMMLLPALSLRRFRPQQRLSPHYAGAVALAVLLALYLLDCLMNAMLNPVFMLAMGGLTAFRGSAVRQSERQPVSRIVRIGGPALAGGT